MPGAQRRDATCERVCTYIHHTHVRTCDTHDGTRVRSFRSLPSADSNYYSEPPPVPREGTSLEEEIKRSRSSYPVFEPVSRVNRARRMRVLPARECVQENRIYTHAYYIRPMRRTWNIFFFSFTSENNRQDK